MVVVELEDEVWWAPGSEVDCEYLDVLKPLLPVVVNASVPFL